MTPRGRFATWLVVALALAGLTGAAKTVAVPGPRVRVRLVSEVRAIEAGATFWVALHQRITRGWHTYWLNPGDSGEPATIEWALPAGFEAGAIAWPHPHRIPVGPVMSYGYSDEVVLPVPIAAPAGLEPGQPVTLRGLARWLVCVKICIPEEAPIALTLPAGVATRDPAGARLIARARRAVPVPSPWPASFLATADAVTLVVGASGLVADRVADVWFYPARWGVIEHAAPQEVRIDARGITLRTMRGPLPEAVETPIEGVLVIAERLDQGTASQAFAVRAVRTGGLAPAGSGGLPSSVTLPRALSLALAGGLLLNLMPCVLPVLSVKVLALVRHAGAGPGVLRWHGLAYTAGVLGSFGLVAGALLALRAAGEQIGWGFQLQSPIFVTMLAYVLFVTALSLSGAVLIGGRLAGAGHALASRTGFAGSFLAGALATVAATPCTAPFMGVAMGFAVAQPWTTALLVFEALGLGFALPFLVFTLVPAWRPLVPRPGAWMERLRQLLAFPLYASVAWLAWVVSEQAGPPGVAVVLAGLVLLGFAAWLFQVSRAAGAPWRRVAVATGALAALASVGLGAVVGTTPPAPRTAAEVTGLPWEPFSSTRLAELRARGVPVFVNVTAAWCITCLVNERVALRSPAVTAAFARKGVVYLKADWTTRDPVITEVLGSFGRTGVPLYLFYPPVPNGGPAPGEPAVLPQILSEGTIIEAIDRI